MVLQTSKIVMNLETKFTSSEKKCLIATGNALSFSILVAKLIFIKIFRKQILLV